MQVTCTGNTPLRARGTVADFPVDPYISRWPGEAHKMLTRTGGHTSAGRRTQVHARACAHVLRALENSRVSECLSASNQQMLGLCAHLAFSRILDTNVLISTQPRTMSMWSQHPHNFKSIFCPCPCCSRVIHCTIMLHGSRISLSVTKCCIVQDPTE